MSGHNNPVRIALAERLRNDPSLLTADIVVSLGTGTQKASASPKATDFRHVILDGYVPRLWRSYMSSFNGQKIWDELMNSLDKGSRETYFRLNATLPSDEPGINNTERMDEMRRSVHTPNVIRGCEKTLYALLISAFYFELDTIPDRVREGWYHCRGMIRCRLPGMAVVELLAKCKATNMIFGIGNDTLAYYGAKLDICISCHRYQKPVEFYVRHPTESVTIHIESLLQGKRKISAFPQSMQWFVIQQKLHAPFGTANHRDLRHRSCNSCILGTALKRHASEDHTRLSISNKRRYRCSIVSY